MLIYHKIGLLPRNTNLEASKTYIQHRIRLKIYYLQNATEKTDTVSFGNTKNIARENHLC